MSEPTQPAKPQVDPLNLAIRLLLDATAALANTAHGGRLADKIALGHAWATLAGALTGAQTLQALTHTEPEWTPPADPPSGLTIVGGN